MGSFVKSLNIIILCHTDNYLCILITLSKRYLFIFLYIDINYMKDKEHFYDELLPMIHRIFILGIGLYYSSHYNTRSLSFVRKHIVFDQP